MAMTTRSALASAAATAIAPREQEEAETNWAEAAASASASAAERPVASALDDVNDVPTRDDDDDDEEEDDEEEDEDEDWVNDPFGDDDDDGDDDDVAHAAHAANDDDDDHLLHLHGVAAAADDDDDYDDDDPHHHHHHHHDNGEAEVLPNDAFHDATNKARNHHRAPWILRVAIPNENGSDDREQQATASIYVDPGMIAERLGRCVLQAVSYSSSYSSSSYSSFPRGAHYERDPFDYNDGPSFHTRSGEFGSFWRGSNKTYTNTNATNATSSSSSSIGIVGLFGNHDGVFYSLECILSMKPADGDRRVFCVQKPSPPLVVAATPNNNNNSNNNESVDGQSGIAARLWSFAARLWSFATTGDSVLVAAAACFGALVAIAVSMSVSVSIIWPDGRNAIGIPIAIVNNILHPWNYWYSHSHSFAASLFRMVPHDLPSAWKLVSVVLDWPAREVYRYGPSVVGWEGKDLVDVCAQIHRKNYYFAVGYGYGYGYGDGNGGLDYDPRNDREYWRQHLGACETIYRTKEESFVRLCRPLWYLGVMVATLWAIFRLVQALFRAVFAAALKSAAALAAFAFPSAFSSASAAEDPSARLDRTDRALLDTYRALRVLVREHALQEGRYQEQQQQQQQQQRQRERQRQRQRQ